MLIRMILIAIHLVGVPFFLICVSEFLRDLRRHRHKSLPTTGLVAGRQGLHHLMDSALTFCTLLARVTASCRLHRGRAVPCCSVRCE